MGGANRAGGGCGRCGGRAIGAMNPYTTDEVELLSLIADLAAGALEKALLYDGMQRQIAELSTVANPTALAIENARLVTHVAVVREMHHRINLICVCCGLGL